MAETWAILYDHRVNDFTLLTDAMFGRVPVRCDLLVAMDPDTSFPDAYTWVMGKYGEYRHSLGDIAWCSTLQVENALFLNGMIVIRSHPEMFGPAIRHAQRLGIQCDVVTVEEYPKRFYPGDEVPS